MKIDCDSDNADDDDHDGEGDDDRYGSISSIMIPIMVIAFYCDEDIMMLW